MIRVRKKEIVIDLAYKMGVKFGGHFCGKKSRLIAESLWYSSHLGKSLNHYNNFFYEEIEKVAAVMNFVCGIDVHLFCDSLFEKKKNEDSLNLCLPKHIYIAKKKRLK